MTIEQVVNRLTMIMVAVSNMPKAKEFYADKLGLKVATDYRQDDDNWYVSVLLPEGGVTITLSTHHEHMQPGTMTVYFATLDVSAAHKALSEKGLKVNEIKDDLYGPGSGVKWFSLEDPDGNRLLIAQG
jgi:catechol 2,3-dioxygenase-like lactoylglutathione lyase family enzyme